MISKDFVLKIFEGFSIQRWTDLVRPFDIVEMDKASEKMVLAYIIGKYEENKQNYVDWKWIIYASLFDLLKKIALCDIKAPVLQMLEKDYPEEYSKLNDWVLSQYKSLLDKNLFKKFTEYTEQKKDFNKIPEESKLASRILSAANKFSTLRELQMLSVVNETFRIEKINTEVQASLQPYLDLTGLQMLFTHQSSFDFLMKIEQLRFQIRWNQTPRVPKTSVLGHCFFVAIITLLLCNENPIKMCKKRIINNYFSALFHDLPEAVTRDIISPVKQATDGLPNIVKKIEDEIVEKELVPLMENFYSDEIIYYTSDEFSNRIQENKISKIVTFEELNEKYNSEIYNPVDGRTVRIADHLSALLEADRSIKHGITSSHLKSGITGMLLSYPENSKINGVEVGKLFREIIQ